VCGTADQCGPRSPVFRFRNLHRYFVGLVAWRWVVAGIAQSVYRQATGWTTGVRFPTEVREFSLLYNVHTGSEDRPASYPVGLGGSFPGLKRQRCETDYSSPSNAKVKKRGGIVPLPHISLWSDTYSVKHRDKFTFYRCVGEQPSIRKQRKHECLKYDSSS
jgi:hypothetical protein